MLTRELMRRLCRLTASREIASAPVEVIAELIDVANEALVEVWLRLPAEMRKYPVTQSLRGPTSVTVAPYAGGVGVGTTLSEWIGCAIQMPDDPVPNRLISSNTLERPHNGESANDGIQQAALVWHDAIHIPETATMFHEEVFVEQNGKHSCVVPWPHTFPLWAEMDVSPSLPCYYAIRGRGFTTPDPVDPLARESGMPELIEPPAGWWLHLLPRPNTAVTVRFTLNIQGERITVADYRRNRRLFVPDRVASYVTRIAEQKLLATALASVADDLRRAIDTEAERARQDLRTLVHSHIEPRGTYGTPAGF